MTARALKQQAKGVPQTAGIVAKPFLELDDALQTSSGAQLEVRQFLPPQGLLIFIFIVFVRRSKASELLFCSTVLFDRPSWPGLIHSDAEMNKHERAGATPSRSQTST